MPKKKRVKERKGKKPRSKSKHNKSQIWLKYKEGKPRFCPRCGPGCILAVHKDRVTCGRCGYCELQKK